MAAGQLAIDTAVLPQVQAPVATAGGHPQLPASRLVWQASLQERFDRAWQPFLTELRRQLEGGYLLPKHVDRARYLLAHKVEARPLLPSNALQVADFIAEQHYRESLLVRQAGTSFEEERALRRKNTPVWADNPLSVTLWIGDTLHATFLCHDIGGVDTGTYVPQPGAAPWPPRMQASLNALHQANLRLGQAFRELKKREGPQGNEGPERWIEVAGAASSELFRIHLTAPDTPPGFPRSWMQVVQPIITHGIGACGVYTHVRVIAHDRSYNSQPAPILQEYRRRTGAPERTDDWDIHLVIPYVDLGLPGNSGHNLHIMCSQVRPHPTHYWLPADHGKL